MIQITCDEPIDEMSPQEVIEKVVDPELAKLNAFLKGLGDSPMSRFESAMVRTYIYQKLKGRFDASLVGVADQPDHDRSRV